ncbi:MAG: PQQ-dependent sugar dehydrogenase [Candidatus Binatia bacterium]
MTARWLGRHSLFALALIAAPAGAEPTLDDPGLAVTTVASGLTYPTTMAFLGPDDILVLQKDDGQVRRVLDGVLLQDPVLDLATQPTGERGLLGIAVNTESPPGVFLYYTEVDDPELNGTPDSGPLLGNRIYRYDWNAATGRLENRALVLSLPVGTAAIHNGGIVVLGPPNPGPGQIGDGALLYTVIGDLTRNGQTANFVDGASPDDTAVILRINQDGTPAAGNPFVPYCSVTTVQQCPTGGGCPGGETCLSGIARYIAYGIRNSFGLALDPVSGSLWQTENGTNFYDELNRITVGMNGGWQQIAGPDARDPEGPADLFQMPGGAAVYDDPEFSWVDTIAPTALVFPSGSLLGANYDDSVLVADFNLGQVYRFPLNPARDALDLTALAGDVQDLVADTAAERDLFRVAHFNRVTDLKIGPDGALYVVDFVDGAIYRVAAVGPQPTPTPLFTPVCGATPALCRTPAVPDKAQITLKDAADDAKDQLVWKWSKGAATSLSDFGDPTRGDGYELCLYDGNGLVGSATAPAAGLCEGRACWSGRGTGFVYKDRLRTPDGLQSINLRAGDAGRASIQVKGQGAALAMPSLTSLASPLTVQLKSAAGACWAARYSFPPAQKQGATLFRDRAD